ncbi:MAG: antibiotic biosynthesis monooxygenase [Rhodospirillales bacterium]|nr:antibiotic biosynthesis monooxygenase [Rhodospirillales bacterium]
MAVLVMVRAVAKPGRRADVVDMLAPFVGEDTGMDGCSRIELAVDAADPDRVVILEEWTSAAAHKANLAALEAAGGLDGFLALLAEAPVRTYYAPLDR